MKKQASFQPDGRSMTLSSPVCLDDGDCADNVQNVFYITYPADDGFLAYDLAKRARLATRIKQELDAIVLADQAIETAQASGADAVRIWALTIKSISAAIVGQRDEALQIGLEALALAEKIADAVLQSRALFAICFVAIEAGQEDQALTCAEAGDSDYDLFWALNTLSHVYGEKAERAATGTGRSQRLEVAFETSKRALDVANRLGVAGPRCYALLNLATAYMIDDAPDRAHILIEQYGSIATQNKDIRLMAFANLDRARLRGMRGPVDGAISILSTQDHQDHLCRTDDLRLRTEAAPARLHKKAGRFEQAFAHLSKARDIERSIVAFESERHMKLLSSRIEMQEARASAEQFQLEAETLVLRNRLLEQERETLQRDAMNDPLTGLGNRRAADDMFADHLHCAMSGEVGFCVVYVDMDHFMAVNDTYGHLVGDQVLVKLAGILRQNCRPQDDLFRFGAEEFVLILTGLDDAAALDACLRLKEAIKTADWSSVSDGLAVTASLGLADWRGETCEEDVMDRADHVLYRAKQGGRDLVMSG